MLSFFVLSKEPFYLQGNGLFYCYHHWRFSFLIKLIDFLITHKCDHSFGSLLPSAIQSQAFIFSPFGRWQGDSGPWVDQNRMLMQNGLPFIIIDLLSPGGGSWREAFHKCSDICPRSGDAKHILPLTTDATALARATMPEWYPICGLGLFCFLLNAYAATQGQ